MSNTVCSQLVDIVGCNHGESNILVVFDVLNTLEAYSIVERTSKKQNTCCHLASNTGMYAVPFSDQTLGHCRPKHSSMGNDTTIVDTIVAQNRPSVEVTIKMHHRNLTINLMKRT
jgi:hypothetical protein